ncbi:MAG: TIGR03790 family protein [Armatimonadetes bacterium]|nr:TIGR03790 family protein [Armatimonadota bacterium]
MFLLLTSLCARAFGGTDRVLVIVNDRSPTSRALGQYYASKRGVPASFICHISVNPGEKVSLEDFHSKIRNPIKHYIQKHGLPNLDFIVTTKGVPLYDNRGFSVDSMLTMLPYGYETQMNNPYFGRAQRFRSKDFKFFLVTRLDGYTLADARALVTRSLQSAGKRGTILLDIDPAKDKLPGYVELNQDMRTAALRLLEREVPYKLDSSENFVGGYKNLMGYYSWGSNDAHFNARSYHSNTFLPGAIAETIVSTSARTFTKENHGQSQIGDLIADGITGVKGYVTEPYGTSMARAQILFDRYTRGFNLAESFYMASPFLCWKDVVIGDPLCSPYAVQPKPAKKARPRKR